MRHRALIVAAVWLIALARLEAQVVPVATLAGSVVDTTGRPLADVAVSATGRNLATFTDSAGRFRLTNVPAGRSQFTFKRIGYTEVSLDSLLPADSTVVVQIRMQNVAVLPDVNVHAQSRSPHLTRDGFYERQQRGFGFYLNPDDIAKMNVSYPSHLLRDVPFVFLDCSLPARKVTGSCIVKGANKVCTSLFVDGIHTRMHLDQRLSPGMVYAVEFYRRSSLVPMEFIRPPSEYGCGAVVVWTQSRKP